MFFRIKEWIDYFAFPIYLLRGKRPWSLGYYTAKKNAICAAIDFGYCRSGNSFPKGFGIGLDERVVEYPWLFAQLPELPGRMLDAGSALNHRFLIDRKPLSNADLTVMTLAPEKRCFWKRGISYIYGDLRKPYFADNSFDVIASVSTIEHIGLDNTLLYTGDSSKNEDDVMGFVQAIREFKRIIKPGGLCFVTVPYGKPGAHGWYQVFNHELVMQVLEAFDPKEFKIDYFGYKAEGWAPAACEEISENEFFDINTSRALQPDLAAAARGVACLRMVA